MMPGWLGQVALLIAQECTVSLEARYYDGAMKILYLAPNAPHFRINLANISKCKFVQYMNISAHLSRPLPVLTMHMNNGKGQEVTVHVEFGGFDELLCNASKPGGFFHPRK
jgi:hypothetical protein